MSSEGGCCTPCIFYNKRPIPSCLQQLYSYESPLSIDTKISTICLRMTSLWRHSVSVTSKFWTYWKYTQKIGKNHFRLNNHRNMLFSRDFRRNKYGNANFNLHIKLHGYILSSIFVICKIRIMEFHQPPSYRKVWRRPYPYGTPKFRFIFVKRCVIGLV